MLIRCKTVRMQVADNQIIADGPGTLLVWVNRNLFTKRIGDTARADRRGGITGDLVERPEWLLRSKQPTLTGIRRPASSSTAKSTLSRKTLCSDARNESFCSLRRHVPFESVQIVLNDAARSDLAHRPKSRIAAIHADRGSVVVIARTVSPDRPLLLCKQRYEADDALEYNGRTGGSEIFGPGHVVMFGNTAAGPVRPRQAAAAALCRTDVWFEQRNDKSASRR